MEKVLTITLNPAIDKSTSVPALVPEKKMRCKPPKFEPGGGGVNVSRALKKLGYKSTAMFLAGGYTGKFFESLLKEEDIETLVIPISSHTRENLIVLDESTNLQYRFGMPGPTIREEEWRECLNRIKACSGCDYVVISGSNAPGIPLEFYAQAAELVKEKKARLIIDTSEEALEYALTKGVFLVKPNLGELSTLAHVKELNAGSVAEVARSIINTGKCEVMVVSMGATGAMVVTKDEHYHAAAPAVKIKSTVGAGDSMLAGIIIGLQKELPLKNVLQYGVACGTAATMNPGTELCNKEDVEQIYSFFT